MRSLPARVRGLRLAGRAALGRAAGSGVELLKALARKGYGVKIFEAASQPGGMLRLGRVDHAVALGKNGIHSQRHVIHGI